MLTTYRYGALHVVQAVTDKDFLQRKLRQLDPRLFIEKQVVLSGELVWCVMLDVGAAEPPWCVLEWRNPDGDPIPHLSDGIVTEIERLMRRGPLSMSAVDEANRRLVQQHEQRASEAYHEIAGDFERMARRSSVVPRSAKLAQTRRRQRAKLPASPSERARLRGPEL